mmetsp:Transcript_104811/g.323265  ORF Transcript_104811/g.323265 Transcript_104811/m.323265 type:complete len:317 (-) Transcript_104811:378-1328(-)
MRQVGHCFVPVSLSHCMKLSSSLCCLLPFRRLRAAYSSHVIPRWYGCAEHRRHESFLHNVHRSRGTSPSPRATRIGQFGVGHAQRSAAEEIACSRLRASRRSMSSGGNSFLRSRSASGEEHSGHVTLAAPTSRRASACLRMHCAQYQPCPQPSRTARQGGASLQQISQASARLLIRMARGLERGVETSRPVTISWHCCCSCCCSRSCSSCSACKSISCLSCSCRPGWNCEGGLDGTCGWECCGACTGRCESLSSSLSASSPPRAGLLVRLLAFRGVRRRSRAAFRRAAASSAAAEELSFALEVASVPLLRLERRRP